MFVVNHELCRDNPPLLLLITSTLPPLTGRLRLLVLVLAGLLQLPATVDLDEKAVGLDSSLAGHPGQTEGFRGNTQSRRLVGRVLF